jgi:hypothetical protein
MTGSGVLFKAPATLSALYDEERPLFRHFVTAPGFGADAIDKPPEIGECRAKIQSWAIKDTPEFS